MYFKNIPYVKYSFGDGEAPVLFDNISAYVDLLDQVKDSTTLYEKYHILDGDRPDIVSQKLYGRSDLHWTFYLMNDGIRESGWPLTNQKLRSNVMDRFPNRVIVTESVLAENFLPGATVTGRTSTTTGTILKRNLDLGQLVIETTGTFTAGELIDEDGTTNSITCKAGVAQYNAVHHYEDADGNWVDINPYSQTSSTSGLTPITIMEYNELFNESLKEIVVIKPSSIQAIVREFYSKMRQ